MITFAIEPFSAVIDELRPFLVAHYQELSEHRERGIPLSPQEHVYRQREAEGSLVMVIGRERGLIVCYFVTFVMPALHYSTCLTALPDIFYVLPQYRRDGTGSALFEFTEKELRRRGVGPWIVGGKVAHPVQALFEIQRFKPFESLWVKWLRE